MDIFNAIGWPIAIPNMQRTIHVKENYTKIEMFTFKVYIIYIFDKFECKRLIFWYDKKIPDYFSVAGAP